ncbi:hypothetical protein ACFQ1S_35975 [Kibdelosporangium lantanae]|uniref:Transcriptional regulator n=1 Tax=Kibdelosporangium lantanae TaxID=1497396 RepID=A0ABW3MN29_9PSEU
MPRKPTPPPTAHLAKVRKSARRLAALEAKAAAERAQRNTLMLEARNAGATGQQLAEAAEIDRRNVPAAIKAAQNGPNPGHNDDNA